MTAHQSVGVGTSANDGTGDSLRAGMQKINSNFANAPILDGQNLFADGSAAAPQHSYTGDSNTGGYRAGADNPALSAGGSQVHSWKTTGNLQPLQPAFLAYLSADAVDVTGDGTQYTVPCDTEVFDQGANYVPGTGVFTAPVTGRYLLSATAGMTGVLSGHTTATLRIVTSSRTYTTTQTLPATAGTYAFDLQVVANMTAGDTASMSMQVSGSTKVVDLTGSSSPRTHFSGALLC